MPHGWEHIYDVGAFTYECGACGERTTGHFGIWQISREGGVLSRVVICSHCGMPTYFRSIDQIYPKPQYGQHVEGITDPPVAELYAQARLCTSYHGFTAANMLCRKILMNLAVSLGAPENQSFKSYIDYLESEGYTPPKGKDWIDEIRRAGNEANHEIRIVGQDEVKRILYFTGLVLQLIYSASHYLKKK